MTKLDPVLERIRAHRWPRPVEVTRASRGYSLFSVRTGQPVARLRPADQDDFFEVLWWRREAWGDIGAFPTILSLDDALDFIGQEPAFWIRA